MLTFFCFQRRMKSYLKTVILIVRCCILDCVDVFWQLFLAKNYTVYNVLWHIFFIALGPGQIFIESQHKISRYCLHKYARKHRKNNVRQ